MTVGRGEPVRLINVCGVGRSGTTLLGQVLAAAGDGEFIGESRYVWRIGYLQNWRCGCGKPFQECPYWTEVDRRAFAGHEPIDAQRLLATQQRLVVRRHLWRLAGLPGSRAHPTAAERDLLAGFGRLYQAAGEVAPGGFLIDTSKEPLFGLLLTQLADVEVHVVHLLRDPRAVAFSWQRVVARDDMAGPGTEMPRPSVAVIANQWASRSVLISSLYRTRAASYTSVRYESFVTDPDAVIRRVRSAIGAAAVPPLARAGDGVVLGGGGHPISGNPRTRASGPVVSLVSDDEWRTQLTKNDERVILARCGALMPGYGYTFRR